MCVESVLCVWCVLSVCRHQLDFLPWPIHVLEGVSGEGGLHKAWRSRGTLLLESLGCIAKYTQTK